MSSFNEKTLSDQTIDLLTAALVSLKKNNDSEESVSDIIKTILSEAIPDLKCDKVYITKGTDVDSNPVMVIPKMTSIILNARNLKEYSVEINHSLYGDEGGYTPEEVALFIIHDIVENLITDNTFMRFKNLLVKYLTESAMNAYNNSRVKSLSSLLWISIFSRTSKDIISATSTSFFSTFIKTYFSCRYVDIWNGAIRKYISLTGGDPAILTSANIDYKDKSDLLTFNKFAREYLSDEHCKYPGDYTRITKYILASNNSKLLHNYISSEPLHSGEFPGKDIYALFDDTKIIYESVDAPVLKNTKNYLSLYNELELAVNGIETNSEKLEAAVKLRAFNVEITKALETDIFNKEVLEMLRYKTNSLIRKLNTINSTESVIDEFI